MRYFTTTLFLVLSQLATAQYSGHWHLAKTVHVNPEPRTNVFYTLDVLGDSLAVFDALRNQDLPPSWAAKARLAGTDAYYAALVTGRNFDAATGNLYLNNWAARKLPPYLRLRLQSPDSLVITEPDLYGNNILYTGRRLPTYDEEQDREYYTLGHCNDHGKDGTEIKGCDRYVFTELNTVSLPTAIFPVRNVTLKKPAIRIYVAKLPVQKRSFFQRKDHSGYGISVDKGEVIPLGQRSIEEIKQLFKIAKSAIPPSDHPSLTASLEIDQNVPAYIVQHLLVQLRMIGQTKIGYRFEDGSVLISKLPPYYPDSPRWSPDKHEPVKVGYQFPSYRVLVGLEKTTDLNALNRSRFIGYTDSTTNSIDTISLYLQLSKSGQTIANDRCIADTDLTELVKSFLISTGPKRAIIYLNTAPKTPYYAYLNQYSRIVEAYNQLWDETAVAKFDRFYPTGDDGTDPDESRKIRRCVRNLVPKVFAVY